MSNRIIEIPNGGGSSGTLEQALMFAASDETSDLAVGTDLLTFAMPFDITLTDVRAFVVTAPTGADLEVDILKNGVSILSTNITIDAGENNSENAATPPVISDTSLSKDDVISVDLIQVGSTVAGAGLKITLAYEAQANVSGGSGGSSLSYSSYVCKLLLKSNGSSPTVLFEENNLGKNITWSVPSGLPGAAGGDFDSPYDDINKILVFVTSRDKDIFGTHSSISLDNISVNGIILQSWNMDTNTREVLLQDLDVCVEIRVYA